MTAHVIGKTRIELMCFYTSEETEHSNIQAVYNTKL